MIEIIPYMLIILGFHPDHPDEVGIERPQFLFVSKQECDEAGVRMTDRMNEAAADKSGARYEFRCLETPAPTEYEDAFNAATGRGE